MGLRKVVERSFDICLDIRDDPVGPGEARRLFLDEPAEAIQPCRYPTPGIGTDLGHITEVVVFELLPGIARAVIHAAQDAAALSIAASIGCCFVLHPLVPFDLTSM